MITAWWIGKDFGRKRSWPNFKILSWYLLGGTEDKDKRNPTKCLTAVWAFLGVKTLLLVFWFLTPCGNVHIYTCLFIFSLFNRTLIQTIWRNILTPSSGGTMCVLNVDIWLKVYMTSQLRSQHQHRHLTWELEKLQIFYLLGAVSIFK
jgi:hypothetical protein